MGEFAIYRGSEIAIGTCEDLYYLRAQQLPLVKVLTGGQSLAGYLKESRFRFPWPDEDDVEPGAFSGYDRSIPVCGYKPPVSLNVKHRSVQFKASGGYLCSLPCPESGIHLDGVHYKLNGYPGAAHLCQQRWWTGMLVGVVRCNGCGVRWRLETLRDAEEVAVALRCQADKDDARANKFHTIADRLLTGYTLTMPNLDSQDGAE
ncbi:MAG TPA: hypothetical protein VGL78_04180 [Solirubrobacteraceae bacterium]|jgi:hypothetical protein